jgi:predicted PurR-regulated permease PerM
MGSGAAPIGEPGDVTRPAPSGSSPSVRVSIDGATVAKLVLGLLLLGVIGHLASQVRDVLIWATAALFLAIALNPLVTRLQPRLSRTGASLAVFGGFVLLLLVVVGAVVAPFVTQVNRLSTDLPGMLERARRSRTFAELDHRFHILAHAKAHAGDLPGYAFGAFHTVVGGVVSSITVLFLSLFLLIELPRLGQLALAQLRPHQRDRAVRIGRHANRQVGGYVFGNLLISVICGAVTLVSLLIFGVPFALTLAAFMAVFDIIPLVGATIGSSVIVIATFLASGTSAGVAMIVIVIVYQQLENHVLQPLIYGRAVQLSSLSVILAVLIGGAVLGLVGALIAIPVAAIVQEVAGEILSDRARQIEADAQREAATGGEPPAAEAFPPG